MSEANGLTAQRSGVPTGLCPHGESVEQGGVLYKGSARSRTSLSLSARSGLPAVVGISGGIGSGKSTLAAELARRGYPVYDTDREAKRIIVHNPAVRSQIETLFGSDVFDGDTYLTDKVAAQVFADSDLLHRLNAIVHPAVRFDLEHWIKALHSHSEAVSQRSGLTAKHSHSAALCFVESAILFESGLSELCSKTVYLDAPEQTRIARTVARDHTAPDRVKARILSQNSDARRLADIVLINDGVLSVSALADQLLEKC